MMAHAVRRFAKFLAVFAALVLCLPVVILIVVNHMPSAPIVKATMAAEPRVIALTGSIESADVVIRSLSEFYEGGNLFVTAEGIATGSDNAASVQLSGWRRGPSGSLSLEVHDVQAVRCRLEVICTAASGAVAEK